jgi:hypothetical protein
MLMLFCVQVLQNENTESNWKEKTCKVAKKAENMN